MGTKNHRNTSPVIAAAGIGGTPYDFFSVIKQARSHVLIAAQNHFYLVNNGEKFKESLLNFLSGDKSRKFDILLCDSNASHAVKTWSYITNQRYKFDLEVATRFFIDLPKWADRCGIGSQLRINYVEFVPISITFIDPDLPTGFMVVMPNAYQSVSNARPIFVLSKKHNHQNIEYYFGQYLQKISEPAIIRRKRPRNK